MFELIIEDYISSAHQLMNYNGPCENLHGHNWKIQMLVEGNELDDAGLVIDFKDLKSILSEELNKYDHKYLNKEININPTSENMAKIIFNNLKPKLPAKVNLKKIFVWESQGAGVSYSGD